MKLVRIEKDVEFNSGTPYKKKLKAGESYMFSDRLAQNTAHSYPEYFGTSADLRSVYNQYRGQNLNGKSLMCWRHGGIGDLMFMMPCLRILKNKYPESKIMVGSGPRFIDIFKNIPYIDVLTVLPISLTTIKNSDYHLHFESIIEDDPTRKAEKMNAYDLFLDRFGFDPSKIPDHEKVPDVFLTDEENRRAEEILRKNKFLPQSKPIISVQVSASTPIRSYPTNELIEALAGLVKRGCNIILLGSPDSQFVVSRNIATGIGERTGIKNAVLNGPNEKLTLRESISLVRHANVMLAPDSAFIHIAAGMRVPIVGLYGPFPAALRMKYYYNAIGLNASTACSPCFTHGHSPCVKGAPSPCFGPLTPDIIVNAISLLLKETGNIELTDMKYYQQVEFDKIRNDVEEYMVGHGADLGAGFTKHKDNVTTIDVNPLCRTVIAGDYFSTKPHEKIDFVISSFVADTIEELKGVAKVAAEILKPGGYFILYVGDTNIVSKISTSFGKMFNLRASFSSTLTQKETSDTIYMMKEFEFVKEAFPKEFSEEDYFAKNIEDLNYGYLTVWRRNEEG